MKTRKEIRSIIGSLMQDAKYQIEFHRSGKSLLVVVDYIDYLSREILHEKANPMLDDSNITLILSRGYSEGTIKDFLYKQYERGIVGICQPLDVSDEEPANIRRMVFNELRNVNFC